MKITVDNLGIAHLVGDPCLQDLYLTVDLLTVASHDTFYFRDTEKVRVNNSISLFTDNIDIKPTIIQILQ